MFWERMSFGATLLLDRLGGYRMLCVPWMLANPVMRSVMMSSQKNQHNQPLRIKSTYHLNSVPILSAHGPQHFLLSWKSVFNSGFSGFPFPLPA